VTAAERRFIADGGWITSSREAWQREIRGIRFEGVYLGFARSHDVYGDGAVVVVPAPVTRLGRSSCFSLYGREAVSLLGIWCAT